MATIGTFKKSANNEFTGEIVTLSVQARSVRIVPETRATGDNAPSHRVFVGRADTTNAGGVFGLESEGENILVKVMPFAEARAMMDCGDIDNSPALIALQWLALHHDEVRNRWR